MEKPLFQHSRYVAESYCFWSNAPFLLISTTRIIDGYSIQLSAYMLCIGICSAWHHAHGARWSVYVDWLPIVALLWQVWRHQWWMFWSFTTWLKVVLTLGVGFNDHVFTTAPVPWGHVLWHVMAAFTMDAAFSEIESYF